MKVYIFGSNGMLGFYISNYLKIANKEVIDITRKDIDIYKADLTELETFFLTNEINENAIIINCIGLIPQAGANGVSLDNRHYIKINTVFPISLAFLAEKHGAKMIHATTDCVFSGDKGNYKESSEHDETNIYGLTKSLGEPKNCTVIRTSIIGEELNNRRSLVEWVKSNRNMTINGYINHFWNGITCLQFAKIVNQIIDTNSFWTGVRHIYSPASVSKYELCNLINEIYNLNINVIPFTCNKDINKTIVTEYGINEIFDIPELSVQIAGMLEFGKPYFTQ